MAMGGTEQHRMDRADDQEGRKVHEIIPPMVRTEERCVDSTARPPSQKDRGMGVSDCCGANMDAIQAEHGICPRCGEHCESEE